MAIMAVEPSEFKEESICPWIRTKSPCHKGGVCSWLKVMVCSRCPNTLSILPGNDLRSSYSSIQLGDAKLPVS